MLNRGLKRSTGAFGAWPPNRAARRRRISLIAGLLILPVVATSAPVGGAATSAGETLIAPGPPSSLGPIRVYVISIDSLDPKEITADTPFLHELKEGGFWFDSVAVPPTTSGPNHVAMLTGVRGNRSGFVANMPTPPREQKFQADHLFTRLARERPDVNTGLFTGGAFRGVFGNRPNDDRPQSGPEVFVATPDPLSAFLGWALTEKAPQFALVHEPKVDDVGHVTPTAETPTLEQAREARRKAIREIDLRLGQVVDGLKAGGVWSETVLIITSDHNMDFAPLTRFIDPAPVLQRPEARCKGSNKDDALLDDPLGQQLVDVLPCEGESKEQFDARVDRIAGLLLDVPDALGRTGGVGLVVSDRTKITRADLGVDFTPDNPDDWRDDPRDILMFAKPSYTFFVFFGVHGHPITQSNVLMVTGGHQALADPTAPFPRAKFPEPTATSFASPLDRPSVLSIAPTAALLLELNRDHFYEGWPLRWAFDPGL